MSTETALSPSEIAAYYQARVPTLKQRGAEWRGRCPIHQGERGSFSVNAETGCWSCHSECQRGGDVYGLEEALSGETEFPQIRAEVERIVGRVAAKPVSEARIVETYHYTDEEGGLLYQVVRFEPKDFRQRRPDGSGGWTWNLNGVRRVLYQLPEIVATQTVYLVEGEKDADWLATLGLPATTAPGGAGKWRPEYTEALKGKKVVIFPDNDAPGRTDAIEKARALLDVAAAVKLVELPGLDEKGDVSDWLDSNHTKDELERMLSGGGMRLPSRRWASRNVAGGQSGIEGAGRTHGRAKWRE